MAILWVDPRVGSGEFITLLNARGVNAQPATLDSGDFCFEGNGPDGKVQIGIERKALSDLVTSLRDGRLCGEATESGKGGQLPRLLAAYDVCWLLVEGQWRADKQGRLFALGRRGENKLPGGFTEDALTKQLLSLELKGQLRLHHTTGVAQSANWLASLLRWWTDKTWEQHQTLKVVHSRQQGVHPLSTFREMTLPLPGVGYQGSKALETYFRGSMLSLLKADEQTLAGIEIQTPKGPRRLGIKAAELRVALNKLL